jgi:hypothetical protein
MADNEDGKPVVNLHDVAAQMKALNVQVTEVARVMAKAVEAQKPVNAAYERLRIAAQAAAECAQRAVELSARARRILEEAQSLPTSLPSAAGTDPRRTEMSRSICRLIDECNDCLGVAIDKDLDPRERKRWVQLAERTLPNILAAMDGYATAYPEEAIATGKIRGEVESLRETIARLIAEIDSIIQVEDQVVAKFAAADLPRN